MLIFGDESGNINLLYFTKPMQQLFETPFKKDDGMQKIYYPVSISLCWFIKFTISAKRRLSSIGMPCWTYMTFFLGPFSSWTTLGCCVNVVQNRALTCHSSWWRKDILILSYESFKTSVYVPTLKVRSIYVCLQHHVSTTCFHF